MYLTEVAESNRQGIGGVIRLRDLRQPKLKPDHFLNLLLGTGSVISHPLFYLGRGIFMSWDL